ncbi:MAG: siderophore ABC transporter substrate-binding protein [Actinomycetaceae bacterium]|nr:siderophore ABC transporter substrate-binding protein [Actinomycetaceae bacterium]
MRKLASAVALAATSALLAGCAGANGAGGDIAEPETSNEAGSFPVTLTHNAGETTVESQPQSIVVLDMAALDTLDAIGAGELVTGVPASDVPTWLSDDEGIDYTQLETVGTMKEPDLEAIAKLNPDLVVLGSRSASFYEEFSQYFTTIDASVPWDQDDYSKRVVDMVEMLGDATGQTEAADEAAANIGDKLAEYSDTAADKGTALVLMSNGGEISMHGPKSRWAPIYDVFGFEPVQDDKADEGHKGQKISFETVQELNPDYIFVVDRDAAVGNTEAGTTAEQVMDNELVASTTAAKEGNIVYLSSERWYIVMTGASNFVAELDEIAAAIQ